MRQYIPVEPNLLVAFVNELKIVCGIYRLWKTSGCIFSYIGTLFCSIYSENIDISIQKFMPDNACDVDIGGCILIMRYAN